MGSEYVGEYDNNFSTDLASRIALELQAEDEEFEGHRRESIIDTLERHAERLREDPPTFDR